MTRFELKGGLVALLALAVAFSLMPRARAQVEARTILHKFGAVVFAGSDVGDVYDNGAAVATYPWQSGAVAVEVISTSDNDGAGDDSGCSSVTFEGLDANYAIQSETVATNGLAAVDAVNSYLRVYRIRCDAAGANGTNVGIISVQVDGAGAILGQVSAARGQSLMAIYTVPAGKRFLMRGWKVSWSAVNATASANCDLYARSENGAARVQDVLYFSGTTIPPPSDWPADVPRVYAAKEDIWINCTSDRAATMSADFYGVLADSN